MTNIDAEQKNENDSEAARCNNRGPRIGSNGVPRCGLLSGHSGRSHAPAPEDEWGNVTW